MRFSVFHETIYNYAKPIRLGEHQIRLTPRPDAGVIVSRKLAVEPTPVARRTALDAFGNTIEHVAFEGETDRFRILSVFELDLASPAPLGPLALPPLPWAGTSAELAPYLVNAEGGADVAEFSARVAAQADDDPLRFLDRLNALLYADFRHDIRDNGGARTPSETLKLGHGACRDLTALFLACCRLQGVAARFVSGYQAHADTPDGRRHLHAWPEAWLPGGAGWRGYDPTHGLDVFDGHVALAAAPNQWPTMPVEGGYWGEAVDSTLAYEVRIETSGG
jgi:transglutaminase-like putative cysteine protease